MQEDYDTPSDTGAIPIFCGNFAKTMNFDNGLYTRGGWIGFVQHQEPSLLGVTFGGEYPGFLCSLTPG